MSHTYKVVATAFLVLGMAAMFGCGSSSTGSDGRPDTRQNLPGISWNRMTSFALHDIARGGTNYVVVGDSGYTAVSSNGTDWRSAYVPDGPNFTSVTYFGGNFYALGDNGDLYKANDQGSFDILSHTSLTSSRIIKRTPELVIVPDQQSYFLRSSDGTNLVRDTVDTAGVVTDIAVKDSVWVAVTNRGIYRSIDGSGWNRVDTSDGLTFAGSSDSLFIVFGRVGFIYRSTDGITWIRTAEIDHPPLTVHDPQFAGGRFISFADAGVYVSTDGHTWTDVHDVHTGSMWPPLSAAGPASKAVTVWWSGDILSTSDFNTWDTTSVGSFYPLEHAFKWNSQYWAVGQRVYGKSLDGLRWQLKAVTDGNDGYVYGYGMTNQLLLYRTNSVDVSTDGSTFTNHATNLTRVLGIISVRDTLCAVNAGDLPEDNGIWWSIDGTSWFKRFPYSGRAFMKIAYGNNTFVAINSHSDVYYSSNNQPWTSGFTFPNFINCLFFDRDRFIACGTHGAVYESTDGIDWQAIAPGLASELTKMIFTGSVYIAITADKQIYAYDEANGWVQRLAGDNYLLDLISDYAEIVVVGDGGTVLVSTNRIPIDR
jgi:hypothetical protein